MIFDDKLLAKLERLAMIKINPEEKDKVAKNLGNTISFMDNIANVNTDSVKISYTQATPLRKDEVSSSFEIAKDILDHAPQASDGYFIVPKIIE